MTFDATTFTEPMKDPKDYLELNNIMKLYNNAKNLRDKALFYTLFFSGRRISEVLMMQTDDILWEEYSIHWNILKKKHPVKVLLPEHKKVISILHKYLVEQHIINRLNVYVFFSTTKGYDYHMTPQRVNQILKEYGKRLNIRTKAGKPPHCHCFRHSFAIWAASMLKNPADLVMLQKKLQHSNPQLTSYYAERVASKMRDFLDQVELPF